MLSVPGASLGAGENATLRCDQESSREGEEMSVSIETAKQGAVITPEMKRVRRYFASARCLS